jgi:UDP-N-acetylmuramoyl-tripeptide--D-alanyl-D-alanine ligase
MNYTTKEELFSLFKQHPYISTDSRIAQPGSLFFALKGENFDGNIYATGAIERGAAYAVIDNPEYYAGTRTLLVKNVLESLQNLASLYRASLGIPIIAITGSNGKTTSKELIAAALSVKFNTHATPGNLNNHIGVPLTILSITAETEIAIIEMGANHIGEIATLCNIARPTHGLITNIGKAHLEGFGGPEGVIIAKNELYQHLSGNGGTVFVNAENPLLMRLSNNINRILFGQPGVADYTGNPVVKGATLNVELQKPVSLMVTTNLTGGYNFENVMAAIAISGHFRSDIKKVAEALAAYQPKMNRSQILETKNNTLILDAYNANPSSMESAIRNFRELDKSPKVLIIGDMFELGDSTEMEHTQVLEIATSAGFDKILTAGPHFRKAATGYNGIKSFEDATGLKEYLNINPLTGNMILIKGSRGMKLEILTDAL